MDDFMRGRFLDDAVHAIDISEGAGTFKTFVTSLNHRVRLPKSRFGELFAHGKFE